MEFAVAKTINKYMDKQYLYKLTFPNGMVYIGIAFDVNERWADNGAHYRGQEVYKHIKRFGWKNIVREVLLYIPYSGVGIQWLRNIETLRGLERELINAYGDRCYNKQTKKEYHRVLAKTRKSQGVYRNSVFWEINGERTPAVEWCKERGVNYVKIKRRVDRYGLTPEQAVLLPPVPPNMARKPVEYWESQGFDFFNGVL